MIPIDSSQMRVTPKWKVRAKRAMERLAALSETDRKRRLSRGSAGIWKDLKPDLEKLSNKKCWYCEARQIRSDMHVDHFRPKAEVDGVDHPGYWWLAFDWKNYRLSCTFCNSPRKDPIRGCTEGKGSQFPLRDEQRRCRAAGTPTDDEQPLLLDPVVNSDPSSLMFQDDGQAISRYSAAEAPWPNERAETSIRIYNLNHNDLKEERRRLYERCNRLVADADNAWTGYTQGLITGQSRFERAVNDIMELVDRNAEFAATARGCIEALAKSGERPWLQGIIGNW